MGIKKIKTIPLSTEVVAESYFADMAKDGLFFCGTVCDDRYGVLELEDRQNGVRI